MFDTARALALASFPPGLPEIEVKRRLCERFYGNDVDVEAFVEYLKSRERRDYARYLTVRSSPINQSHRVFLPSTSSKSSSWDAGPGWPAVRPLRLRAARTGLFNVCGLRQLRYG